MERNKFPPDWIIVDHIIPNVTTEMLDWWWVNMEKGYELWCPDEHKGFKWEIKPPLNGHIGAVQIATESIDYGPVMDLRIEWVDPNIGTPEQKDFWPDGCKMRSCMHGVPEPPPGSGPVLPKSGIIPQHPSGKKPTGGGWRAHNIAEVSTFKDFLPALWGIWQAVTDPAINRHCSLKIKKEGSRIIYV